MKAKIKAMAPRAIAELLTILACAMTVSLAEAGLGDDSMREAMYLGLGAYAYRPLRELLKKQLSKRIK